MPDLRTRAVSSTDYLDLWLWTVGGEWTMERRILKTNKWRQRICSTVY